MYDTTISLYIKSLTNLKEILTKAKAWQETNGYKEEAVTGAHLAVDQFPFIRQVQMAADFAKKSGAIIAGVAIPSYEDNEKTIAELQARIDKTVTFLESLPKGQVASDLDTKMIPFPWVPGKGFVARYYVEEYALPQFYFHYTIAYSILRNFGLNLGKQDFLGSVDLRDLA